MVALESNKESDKGNHSWTFSRFMETLITLGTPLEQEIPEGKQKDKKLHIPQPVNDERGRVKLRGAFQGSYVAGYNNTVGSKEGWAPQQFISSRNEKKLLNSSIYDFMDEDDIKEFGGLRQIEEDYSSLGSTERELERKNIVRVGSTGQEVVIEKPRDHGAKLLLAMGYKPDMKVGKRKLLIESAFSEEIRSIRSFNTFGRGYDPLKNAPEFKEAQKKKKIDIRQMLQDRDEGGFGTGIFEEDDEIALYSVPASNYDIELDEDKYTLQNRNQVQEVVKGKRHRPGILHGFVPVETSQRPTKM
jgi:G patch domain-containing protein 1